MPGDQENRAKRLFIFTNSGETVYGWGVEAPVVLRRASLACSWASYLIGQLPIKGTGSIVHLFMTMYGGV